MAFQDTTDSAAQQNPQLIVVSCYTRFDNLAHGPRGTEADQAFYIFELDTNDGQMVLISKTSEAVMNPAFSRFHPKKNVLYTCTESVAEDGIIDSWAVCPQTGRLSKLRDCGARGSSTCYLTLDKELENMLVVNYWDATIGVFRLDPRTGAVLDCRSMYDPKEGRPMVARSDRHVNHSHNDAVAQKERQMDPHSHAVILDPIFGRIAYVPDLGMDIIRTFYYDQAEGTLTDLGTIPSGPQGRVALGPRYMEFHPTLPVVYVINELSSEVSVFEFDREAALRAIESKGAIVNPTLRLAQTLSTIPEGYPGELNTCGRIAVHPAGNFVLVSNRGHDSIAVFCVHHEFPFAGMLSVASVQHTRGATPRHFQFDKSSQWLITANQDSNAVGIFRFNLATGKLDWTGHEYHVPSPNFVCAVMPHVRPAEEKTLATQEGAVLADRRISPSMPFPVPLSSKL